MACLHRDSEKDTSSHREWQTEWIKTPQNCAALCEAIFNMSPLPISITRLKDRCYVQVNRKWCEMTGFEPEAVIGRTARELAITADPLDDEHIVAELRKQGCFEKFETSFRHIDNRLIQAHLYGQIIDYEGWQCIVTTVVHQGEPDRAQGAVSQRENRLHTILNSFKESYYETDLNGTITFFNNALLSTYHSTDEELRGMNFQEYTVPEDIAKVYAAFNDVYKGKSEVEFVDYGIIRNDGSLAYAECSVSLLRDATGRAIGFYGISRDRTEQKKAQESLRLSEEKHRTILENMTEGYYEVDLDGNYTAFNEATCKLLGYPAEELMGLNYKVYLSPEEAEEHNRIYKLMRKTGRPAELFDSDIIRKDGMRRRAEISASPMKNQDGEVIGFWGFSRDRTEHAQAESEAQYRQLVNSAADGIYITQQGRIKYHNPKTAAITGYSDQELANMQFLSIVHPKDKCMHHEIEQRMLNEGKSPGIYAFRIYSKTGQLLWVELSTIGIRWKGLPAALNYLRDVTPQKKTEALLRQAQKMESIGTLAGGIAHDFNNILTAMIGYTELCLEDAGRGTALEENLTEVMTAGKRAKELVRQILTFARQSEEQVEPIQVGAAVKEALKLLRSSIPTTIDIQTEIDSVGSILGNPTQVHQIIMNLCTNAAHAMEQTGGVIKVKLTDIQNSEVDSIGTDIRQASDYIRLTVTDTGCGIETQLLQTIFEPYFTTKGPGEGTGMGLSVVQGIVEKYGGKISVQSEVGQGTTIIVDLPVSMQPAVSVPEQTCDRTTSNERILLVDDEPAIAKMGSQMLERMGYIVTFHSSSMKALEQFRAQSDAFDLVITDMAMPSMAGDQLAREILRIRPDIPVVLCTGYSKQINEKSVKAIGIRALVYKPIQKNDLKAVIRKALDGH